MCGDSQSRRYERLNGQSIKPDHLLNTTQLSEYLVQTKTPVLSTSITFLGP